MFALARLAGGIICSIIALFLPLTGGALAQEDGLPASHQIASSHRERAQNQTLSIRAPQGAPNLTLRPGEPLTRAIQPGMPARSVLGLRLLEQGRRLLEKGEYARALMRLEKSLAIYATPYTYYYLAWVHYRLRRHRNSLGFVDVAESRLQDEAVWADELAALRGLALRALRSSRPPEMERDAARIVRQSPAAPESTSTPLKSLNVRAGGTEEARARYVVDLVLFGLAAVAITAFWLPRHAARRSS